MTIDELSREVLAAYDEQCHYLAELQGKVKRRKTGVLPERAEMFEIEYTKGRRDAALEFLMKLRGVEQ